MSTPTQTERLQAWYSTLNPREQLFVRVGVIGGAALLALVLVLRLHGAVFAMEKRVAAKHADAAYIQSVLPELQAAPAQAADGQSLVTVIDRTTRDAGLGVNLRGTEPSGMQGVTVRFEGASFEALVTWLLRVEREYGLAITTATFEKTDAPGRVNANLTFTRS
jgi:type II secretory pathway component PulM